MCSLGAAGTALDVVVSTFGAPRLARAPERLLRPDEEEDDRREDRQINSGGEPVLLVGVRRVLVDDEPLVRALGHVGPETDEVRAFVESSESIDPARFRAMTVFCEREA